MGVGSGNERRCMMWGCWWKRGGWGGLFWVRERMTVGEKVVVERES